MIRFKPIAVFVAALAVIAMNPARADDNYPTRPIRLVVGFAAGSSGDVMARIVGHKLGDMLKQTVIVENKPGASSMVATDYVARSAKDGYTLMFATIATTINMTLMAGKAPNVEKDMTPITLIGSIPNILVVNPKLGVNDVKGLIALAKQKPDELLYGASGLGSGPHLATELFKQMAGIDIVHIPYKGAAPAMNDLIGGHIPIMFDTLPTVLPAATAGNIRVLAVTSKERAAALPNVPTLDEAGVKGFEATAWFGLYMPAANNNAAYTKLVATMKEILSAPATREKFATQGVDPGKLTGAEFTTFVNAEIAKWANVVKAANVPQE